LLEPLEYGQVAPILFLLMAKFITIVFGNSELSLRFIPLLFSLLSIYLFYELTNVFISRKYTLYIISIFVLLTPMVYYSSEVKQYSLDVFVLIFLFWLYYKFVRNIATRRILVVYSLAGALTIWLSNIAIIVLSSICLAMISNSLKTRNWSNMQSSIICISVWLVSFYIYYSNFIIDHPHTLGMQRYWQDHFMPHHIIKSIGWLGESLFWIFRNTVGQFELAIPAMIVFLIGIYATLRDKNKQGLIYLLLPLIIHVVLSYLNLYPFGDRLVLYLVPVFLLFELKGIELLVKQTSWKRLAGFTLIFLFVLSTMIRASNQFLWPVFKEDIKPVFAYIQNQKLPTDNVYIYSSSTSPFRYYKSRFFDKNDHVIEGISSLENFEKFVEQYKQLDGRTWMVFSHQLPKVGIRHIEDDLEHQIILDFYDSDGAKCYLVRKEP
jgi:uncharacterized membrane protein